MAGAGIAGLCCAYELMQQGHEVTVLEATGRCGGHVFTGRDELSDGLYADFGADHITKPGYERVLGYVEAFGLELIPYPCAEGSAATPDPDRQRMIDGAFYTDRMLSDQRVLAKLGFNGPELEFLRGHPLYELPALYVAPHLGRFDDEFQPFGVGLDHLDSLSMTAFCRREGASDAALRFLEVGDESALYSLWRFAVMQRRGIPWSEGDTYRIRGGNQALPLAFARRLGDRVRLGHRVTGVQHDGEGVRVTYRAFGRVDDHEFAADAFVNCLPLSVFRTLAVTPALSPAKRYVVDNLGFSSHPFFVFEALSRFWVDDGFRSINMEFEHPDISSVWQEATDVDTHRVILKAFGTGGVPADRGLAAFRAVYPGKRDTIVRALTVDWTKDAFSPSCEMLPFPAGETRRLWPEILRPEGRLYFAGTYADPLSRGMESCVRSAQRVAQEIGRL